MRENRGKKRKKKIWGKIEEEEKVEINWKMLFFQPSVTLVTQASLDRLAVLERSLNSWRGPVSIAVFIPARGSKAGGGEGRGGGGGGGSGGSGVSGKTGGGEETEWQR